jgi:hypothetical protein
VGGGPVRIDSVQIEQGWGEAADFQVRPIGQPVAVPLPLIVEPGVNRGSSWRWDAEAEGAELLTLVVGSSHLSLRPTARLQTRIQEQWLEADHGPLMRGETQASFGPADLGPDRAIPPVRVSYAPLSLPVTLQAGQRLDLQVSAAPSAWGLRQARVRVRGVSLLDNNRPIEVVANVNVEGRMGPRIQASPQVLHFATGAGVEQQRILLIENAGDVGTDIGTPVLQTAAGVPLPPTSRFKLVDDEANVNRLAPGSSRALRVVYSHQCRAGSNQHDVAMLEWPLNNQPPLRVAIDAVALCSP